MQGQYYHNLKYIINSQKKLKDIYVKINQAVSYLDIFSRYTFNTCTHYIYILDR